MCPVDLFQRSVVATFGASLDCEFSFILASTLAFSFFQTLLLYSTVLCVWLANDALGR